MALQCLDIPDTLCFIPGCTIDACVERGVFPQIKSIGYMGNVLAQLLVVGEAIVEMPVFVNLWNVQLIEWALRVNSCATSGRQLSVLISQPGANGV